MAQGFTITITGIEDTLKKLGSEKDKYQDAFDFAFAANTQAMANEAKNRVAVDTGRLKNSITAKKNADLNYEIVAQTKYAPYIEFGTGKYASSYVPTIEKEWQELAIKFRSSSGKKTNNLIERPYLRPSVLRILPILNKDLQDIADKKVEI